MTAGLSSARRSKIFFEGDEYNEWDPWWKPALSIRLDAQPDRGNRRVR